MTRRNDEIAAAPMLRRFTDLQRFTIGASDGDVGTVEDVYFDDISWTVRYLVVDTGTWLSGRKVLVSPAAIREVDGAGDRLITALTRGQIESSPSIDTAKPVSRQQETELLTYYGHAPYWAGPYRWGASTIAYPLVPPLAGAPPPSRTDEEMAARERASRDEHLRSAHAVRGYGIRATDGELGHVEDYLIAEQEWAIRYLIVDPRSWWPGPHVIVGIDWIRGVSWEDTTVEVDVTREAVRNAPRYESTSPFSRGEETRLYTHHGRPGYWDRRPEFWMHYPPAA